MRRTVVLVALAGCGLIALFVSWQPRKTTAQQPVGAPAPAAAAPANVPLPITQVVLFSSGVGYFQREGEVDGETRIDLAFPADNVNDLLKSLVLQDQGGGKIKPVSYDNQEPVERTLKTFGIDLSGNPSFGQILNQARGQKAEVVMQQSATTQPGTLTGVVIGMEARQNPNGMSELEMLNLQCTEGLRCLPLDQVQRIRFLNPVLDGELRRALEVLATVHDSQKKRVSLGFKGDGKRKVRVGYVVENPIWKTSYRLVLDDAGQPHLQGWAMVENTTDEDWNDLRMVLVAGRPLSFQMNLYQPLYVPRPVVEPEHFASLRPPAYTGAMAMEGQGGVNLGVGGIGGIGGGNLGFAGGGLQGANLGIAGGAVNLGVGGGQFGQQGFFNRYQNAQGQFGGQQGMPRLSYEDLQRRRQELQEARAEAKMVGSNVAALDPTEGVVAAATAQQAGSHFRYVIDQNVTLPRQKSAMLPIVDDKIEGHRISIYNEKVQARYPLLGLKLKNTSGKQLMQGPITVYEDGQYAGDARILDLQPGEVRLVSYAVDQGMEIKTETTTGPGPVQAVTLPTTAGGWVVHYPLREKKTYVIANRSPQDRKLVLEHPVRPDWRLTSSVQPEERSRDHYRFQVPVAAGQSLRYEVIEEHDDSAKLDLALANEGGWRSQGHGVIARILPFIPPDELLKLWIVRGKLQAEYRVRSHWTYQLTNHTKQPVKFLIDHASEDGWKEVTPEPKERSGQTYRYERTVPAGQLGSVEVIQVRTRKEEQALDAVEEKGLQKLLDSSVSSAGVKAALRKWLAQREKQAGTRRTLADLDEQLKGIAEDQTRLRANLDKVPPTSAAYKRYLTKFDDQETEIEKLQMQIKELKKTEKQQLKEAADFLAELSVE